MSSAHLPNATRIIVVNNNTRLMDSISEDNHTFSALCFQLLQWEGTSQCRRQLVVMIGPK